MTSYQDLQGRVHDLAILERPYPFSDSPPVLVLVASKGGWQAMAPAGLTYDDREMAAANILEAARHDLLASALLGIAPRYNTP